MILKQIKYQKILMKNNFYNKILEIVIYIFKINKIKLKNLDKIFKINKNWILKFLILKRIII
jgi:hypothetical protein